MLSKKTIAALLMMCAASVLILTACSMGGDSSDKAGPSAADSGQTGAYHKIDAEEGKQMIDAGGVIIVDVRTPEEYASGHIPGAISIPNENISTQQPEGLSDFDEDLIVYCRTGVRSKQASDKLIAIGYQNVYDMGGIVDWPYNTVKE